PSRSHLLVVTLGREQFLWPELRRGRGRAVPAPGHDEREVVVLLVGAERADLVHQAREQQLRRAVAMPLKRVDQALLAELLAGVVERLGDAAGVEREKVVRLEAALADRAPPLREDAEDRRGRPQPLDAPVAAQEQSAKVAAIHVAEPAGRIVVLGEDQAGE